MHEGNTKSSELIKLTQNLSTALRSLPSIARNVSLVFEEQVSLRLAAFARQLDEYRQLTLSFQATETWRTVYQEVLEGCDIHRYLSVALIQSDEYWRDEPGKASLEFNYRLIDHGFAVQRAFIIDPFFWPPSAKKPSIEVLNWIMDQHDHGIMVSLVRLTDLEAEPELVCDMGIYGNDAVGKQVTDFDGRTLRFELFFDPAQIKEAEAHWNRIQLYAVQIEEVLV